MGCCGSKNAYRYVSVPQGARGVDEPGAESPPSAAAEAASAAVVAPASEVELSAQPPSAPPPSAAPGASSALSERLAEAASTSRERLAEAACTSRELIADAVASADKIIKNSFTTSHGPEKGVQDTHGEESVPLLKSIFAGKTEKDISREDSGASNGKRLSRTMSDKDRMDEFCKGLKNTPPSPGVQCFCTYVMKPLILIIMFYIWVGKLIYRVVSVLPMNVLKVLFGIGLCFFGGSYFATFAAVEAAMNFGGPDLRFHLTVLWEEGSRIGQAHLVDDAEVLSMSWSEAITHKAKVSMMGVKDPDQLEKALTALTEVWIAVLACLRFQFARTLALLLGLSNMLGPVVTKLLAPLLVGILGKDLAHWAPTMIDTTIKIILVSIASMIQATISGYYSALRGGKMFALAVLDLSSERGLMDRLPDWLVDKPFDPDASFIDEAIGYPLAAAGFYWQFTNLFQPPDFPWSLLVLPVTLTEWFIRWEVYT